MSAYQKTGYLLGLLAAITYGMNPLFALPLLNAGIPAFSVLFYRYLLAIPVLAVIMLVKDVSFRTDFKNLFTLAILGILLGISSLTLFQSYGFMNAGIASTMLFVYPLMVAVLMILFFKERFSWITFGALALSLSGIWLLFKGNGETSLSLTGTVLVMISALSYAIYIIGVKHTDVKTMPPLTMTFYVLLFGMLVFLCNMAVTGSHDMPRGWFQWGDALCLALLPTALSFLCTTESIIRIGSTPTAILGAMEPVTAVIIGILVFNETLSIRDISGILLIIISVLVVILSGTSAKAHAHKLHIKRKSEL